MGFAGALRNIVRPLSVASSRALMPRISINASMAPFCPAFPSPCKTPQWLHPLWNQFHSLTDTRFPKRRPSEKPRRKRASLRPSGVSLFVLLILKLNSNFEMLYLVQGLMLGFNIHLANPYFQISLMKGVSKGEMRRNAWGNAGPLYWCALPLPCTHWVFEDLWVWVCFLRRKFILLADCVRTGWWLQNE